ncbi:ZmEBE-2 protein [Panicum miliaceum]|uniref:ZmEBE-2 protein n=1 Tax=Panicum miliaceum TaxID=4540 RepID=A0A3L6RYJ7_PANMI|nr:ZmEBE-2 protein [Panicum miliaceum]
MATLDVYNYPYMKKGEVTAASYWVANEQNDKGADQNYIQAGWAVGSNVCFNLNCNGFVPVNGAPITPGDTLESPKGQTKITFKVFKSQDDGDWWLHFGYNTNNLKPVGFWPKSTFTSLRDHAKRITWGGFAGSSNGNPTPPMGNGQWPWKNSASFQNV